MSTARSPRPVLVAEHDPTPLGEEPPRRLRAARRNLSLPNGRALTGGLLIALSALGLYSAWRSASAGPTQQRLVAVRDIGPGAVIGADDLGLAQVDLYPGTDRRSFADADQLIGRRALIGIRRDELVQRSMVATPAGSEQAVSRRITIELSAAAALDGRVESGERIDVVSTDDRSGETRVVAEDVMVESRPTADDSTIGGSGSVRLTLLVPDETTALAVIDAAQTAKVSLIGSSAVDLAAAGAAPKRADR